MESIDENERDYYEAGFNMTTKHYIVIGMSLFSITLIYFFFAHYKFTFLTDRTGATYNSKDYELTTYDEMNPFLVSNRVGYR